MPGPHSLRLLGHDEQGRMAARLVNKVWTTLEPQTVITSFEHDSAATDVVVTVGMGTSYTAAEFTMSSFRYSLDGAPWVRKNGSNTLQLQVFTFLHLQFTPSIACLNHPFSCLNHPYTCSNHPLLRV